MCGRFASTTPPDQIAAYFGAEASADTDEPEPDFNVAPTRDVPVVRVRAGERHLDHLRWGLVPRWAKDLRIGSKMINARSETVATKNAYRSAFKKRRCIVAADGFYEWKRLDDKNKQPMYITRGDGDLLAFAGLYERWTDAGTPKSSTWVALGSVMIGYDNEGSGAPVSGRIRRRKTAR